MGNLVSASTCTGVIGGALLGVAMDRFRAYKILTLIALTGLMGGFVWLYFACIYAINII